MYIYTLRTCVYVHCRQTPCDLRFIYTHVACSARVFSSNVAINQRGKGPQPNMQPEKRRGRDFGKAELMCFVIWGLLKASIRKKNHIKCVGSKRGKLVNLFVNGNGWQ